MPDFLLELFSEEIPARMQRRAADDLKQLVTDALVERGCLYEGARAFATPRRLALHIAGLPARQPDTREEKKGPRVDAPAGAVQGFLKSAGLSDIAQADIRRDPKKGDFYVAVIERPGRPLPDLLADILPGIVKTFPWPKAMRWGAASAKPGSLRWVRPLHSILATFGPETETPEIVAFAVDAIAAGDITRGHRFMAPAPFRVRRFDDYERKLHEAKVVLDQGRRKDIILHDARDLAFAQGLELIEDEGLLEEVAGLVEWPVVLMGAFDEGFLGLPREAIRATIRANQKCFVLRDGATGALANRFLLVANLVARDGGAAIIAGNERVVRARLADARHFWEVDQRDLPDYRGRGLKPLDQRLKKLRDLGIVFHEKLGTQGERVDRLIALAREIAPLVGADSELAARAAELAKADLVTEMVGEFPELQGLMGRHYALLQGEDPRVAAAIEEHYKPQGPSDRVPTEPVSIAVALADKLDTLVGFWAIGEKPTGSKDPYALRRAALGVVRIVVENGLRLPLFILLARHEIRVEFHIGFTSSTHRYADIVDVVRLLYNDQLRGTIDIDKILDDLTAIFPATTELVGMSVADLLAFFHDRLKVYLRDQGARHDLIDAALAPLPLVGRVGVGVAPSPPINPAREGAPSSNHASTPTPSPSPQGGGGPAAASGGVSHDPIHAALAGASTVIPGAPKAREGDPGATGAAAGSPSRPATQVAGDDTVRADAGDGRHSAGSNDDLLMVVRRVEALGRFLDTPDGQNLLAGVKRASNILRIEEKKDGPHDGPVDPARLVLPEELALAQTLQTGAMAAREHVANEDFAGAMAALARLRPAVDAFFEHVTVNADDLALRANRLRLLARLREATREVADFSLIQGQ